MLEDLNLVVKFGAPDRGTIDGAITMQAVHHAFTQTELAVPQLFGWRVDNEQKDAVSQQLRGIVHRLKELQPPKSFIGESQCVQLSSTVEALTRTDNYQVRSPVVAL